MTTKNTNTATPELQLFISPDAMLNEWLGHRRLTRRVIDTFPEDKFFNYSIGGMRTFSGMVKELIDISAPGLKGIATGNWENTANFADHAFKPEDSTKENVLKLWDQGTDEIIKFWKEIPEERFQETVLAFGAYEGQVFSIIKYLAENEVHHCAQGVVYLRSLGIVPPAFWDRN